MYVTDLTAKRGPLWFLPIAPEIENPEENPALLLTGVFFNYFAMLQISVRFWGLNFTNLFIFHLSHWLCLETEEMANTFDAESCSGLVHYICLLIIYYFLFIQVSFLYISVLQCKIDCVKIV